MRRSLMAVEEHRRRSSQPPMHAVMNSHTVGSLGVNYTAVKGHRAQYLCRQRCVLYVMLITIGTNVASCFAST
jgi:hypothetical protein